MAYFDLNFKKRKCSKRDLTEGDYRQRRAAPTRKRGAEASVSAGGQQPLGLIAPDPVKIEGCSMPEIFPVKTSSFTTGDERLSKKEVLKEELGEEELRAAAEGGAVEEGMLLKGLHSTFMSFYELEQWEKVHMLEESEEYAYHYNPLHQ